ncbi:DUF2199 domain-containing protein [Bacillus mycoides]|uniref:DUF2199 domain-containing protein n=1 Tax=Bacillus mycoides TaxID=1405 RepID=UPI0035CC7413
MKRRRKSGEKIQMNRFTLPLCYGSEAPYYYYEVEPHEREGRFHLTSDLCVMDDEHYFIRGCLELPIIDYHESFIWTVWVSLSKESYDKVLEKWDERGRENSDPYFGWLSVEIPVYSETLNLKTNIHIREVGMAPFIELEPTDHPLALEQRNGITLERVKEIQEIIQRYN